MRQNHANLQPAKRPCSFSTREKQRSRPRHLLSHKSDKSTSSRKLQYFGEIGIALESRLRLATKPTELRHEPDNEHNLVSDVFDHMHERRLLLFSGSDFAFNARTPKLTTGLCASRNCYRFSKCGDIGRTCRR